VLRANLLRHKYRETNIALIYLAYLSPLFLFIAFNLKGQFDLTSAKTFYFLISCLALWVMLVFVQSRYLLISKNLPIFFVTICSSALLIFAIKNTDSFKNSLKNLGLNLFTLEFWGGTWWAIVFCFIVALFSVKKWGQLEIKFSIFLLCAVFGILCLGYMHPFRYGWGDSANRMFVHLLPLCLLWVAMRATALLHNRAI
jgi:hypothetical protein